MAEGCISYGSLFTPILTALLPTLNALAFPTSSKVLLQPVLWERLQVGDIGHVARGGGLERLRNMVEDCLVGRPPNTFIEKNIGLRTENCTDAYDSPSVGISSAPGGELRLMHVATLLPAPFRDPALAEDAEVKAQLLQLVLGDNAGLSDEITCDADLAAIEKQIPADPLHALSRAALVCRAKLQLSLKSNEKREAAHYEAITGLWELSCIDCKGLARILHVRLIIQYIRQAVPTILGVSIARQCTKLLLCSSMEQSWRSDHSYCLLGHPRAW
jgi:hypothetical protein